MIKRSDGRWQEQITITEHGKNKRKYFYGKTQKEVKRKMLEYQQSQATGRTFAVVEADWENDHFPNIQHGTQVSYSPAVKRALSVFGDQPIQNITPLEIDRSVQQMAKKGYSHQSVKIYLSVLRQVCDFGVLSGDLTVNPTTSIRLPRNLPKKERELPSDEIISAIVTHADIPFGLFAYFLMLTGMRRGEALAIQWQDIDFENSIIHVRKSICYVGDKPVLKQPKTKSGIRDVILLSRLANKLLPIQGKPTHYLFGGEAPLSLDRYDRLWHQYSLAAGLAHTEKRHVKYKKQEYDKTYYVQHVTPHQLRHAFATFLFEADVDVNDAKEQLGHSSIEVTRDIYTHIRKARKKSTASKLNDAIDSILK